MDEKKAQAAIELAVFGAILIFILGTVIRSAVGNSYAQNQNLKAMRMAMLASWNNSQADFNGNPPSSGLPRNSASILFVEDRMSPDVTKYGPLDRSVEMANGSGTFTYMLMYPIDATDVGSSLPIMDVYINGQQFPFTTAWFEQGVKISPTTNSSISPTTCSSTGGPYTVLPLTPAQCRQNQCLRNAREWVTYGGQTYKLFYAQQVNSTPLFFLTPPPCGTHNTTACKDRELSSDANLGGVSNANGDLMFDLQRNSTSGNNLSVPTALRPYMAWQWSATAGTTAAMIGLDADNQQYPSYDIDGRLKEVTIYNISSSTNANNPYVIVSYEDPAGGDIDSSWDSNSCTPKPGLQNDSQIYTVTQDGTYLQIKEGKLYNPETDQVVRSVNKRDNVDLIQREIQLSNNTGRFCSLPTGSQATQVCPSGGVYQGVTCASPNPVEACVASGVSASNGSVNDCFNGSNANGQNIKQTCMDVSTNMIYVRSRLNDRGGRFWITDTSGQLGVQ